MDDLSVEPMSSISSITLLSKFGVNELDALEERTVSLGVDEICLGIGAAQGIPAVEDGFDRRFRCWAWE
ncbi:hypothetical protein ACP70R_031146 [Stipagrostis hirtigluma subsp. patula]